jgi:hypothetical protein
MLWLSRLYMHILPPSRRCVKKRIFKNPDRNSSRWRSPNVQALIFPTSIIPIR